MKSTTKYYEHKQQDIKTGNFLAQNSISKASKYKKYHIQDPQYPAANYKSTIPKTQKQILVLKWNCLSFKKRNKELNPKIMKTHFKLVTTKFNHEGEIKKESYDFLACSRERAWPK